MKSSSNIRIFFALLHRDFIVIKQSLIGELVDGFILLVIQVITFSKLFPLIGMPTEFVAPLFIGSGLFYILLTRGYTIAMFVTYKIPSEGFGVLAYHCTLPIPIWWIFAEYIVFFVIETSIITIPMFIIGINFLPQFGVLSLYRWLLLLTAYILTLIFWGAYFWGSAFMYDFEWYRDSFWPRRIEIVLCLSTIYFPWIVLYNFSSFLGWLVLCNPITPMVEGMRTILLQEGTALPLNWCFSMLVFWVAIVVYRLRWSVIRRLDPVI